MPSARRRLRSTLALFLTASLSAAALAVVDAPPPEPWRAGSYFPPSPGPWPSERLTPLLRAVSTDQLRAWHDLLGSEPHVAGSPGDQRVIEKLAAALAEMGLEVERHDIWVYLARPVSAVLEIVEPASGDQPEHRTPLVLKERILPEDADSASPDLSWGWNAFSGSGDVTGEIVYANQGTKADFATLAALGVDLKGKVVLCRYGGNFRGHKVRFAQAAGAAAVVIFTDPGPGGVAPYPTGGAPNDTCIERGSINMLDHPGDPLTPGREAAEHAEREDPTSVDLPRIPVQPIGWGAAREILIRMAAADAPGPALPDGWQGGIPVPYRINGGPGLRLRVKVEQIRQVTPTANVVATLRGREQPDQWVIVGSHHDAWGFGACDPLAGSICTLESARVLAEAAKAGWRPRRSIKFGFWGAEEFSIIGSTEWVESRRAELERSGIAYLNLDMSAMGPNFGAAASPALRTVITTVTRHVPAVGAQLTESGDIIGPTVFDTWISREADPTLPGQPRFGPLGGGSDHVAFWCHAGVPSAGLGCSGTPGSAYHSVYDTLTWYRRNVGEDYAPARMLTQVVVGTLARLADDAVPPVDHARTAWDVAARLDELRPAAMLLDAGLAEAMRALAEKARRHAASAVSTPRNGWTAEWQRAWLAADGLPERHWYRNELASPDRDAGYAAWVLPDLTWALDRRDTAGALAACRRYAAILDELDHALACDPGAPASITPVAP